MWAGELCFRGPLQGQACVSDADCAGNFCGVPEGLSAAGPNRRACPLSTVCVAGDPAKLGSICTVDANCSSSDRADGDCSANPVQTTRTRICNDDGSAGQMCDWSSPSFLGASVAGSFEGIECKGPITCGNGTLDAGELCDDGNKNNTDTCTNECRLNVCGDGYVQAGIEACDAGSQNGVMCRSSYGSTCNYCSNSCQFVATSGAYCGDGVRNGGEYCDQADIPYVFISNTGDIFSTCEPSQAGNSFRDTASGITYVCARVGMCNGGANNGAYCSPTAGTSFVNCAIGGGVCEFGSCDASCSLACPTSTSPALMRMSTNTSGSATSTSVELASYTTLLEGRETLIVPTAASLIIPACRVATTPVADIDFLFDDGNAKIAIVMDRTFESSRKSPPRLTAQKTIAERIVNYVFDDEDLDAKVALYSYPYTGGAGTVSRDTALLCPPGAPEAECDGFFGKEAQTGILTKINSYTAAPASAGYGNMNAGLASAWQGLNTNWNGEKRVIVLLSYGEHASGQGPDNAIPPGFPSELMPNTGTLIQSIRNDGVYVYTVSVQPNSGLARLSHTVGSPQLNMISWSSGFEGAGTGLDPNTGIDFAYNVVRTADPAPLASGIEDMVTRLLASVRFSFIIDGVLSNGIVREGNGVELPWPSGFRCDEDRAQSVPFRLYFEDKDEQDNPGHVTIQNVKFNICTP